LTSNVLAELTEAKLLLRHGIFHINQGRPSRLDRRLAVHHAHHAVELTLRRKASELGASTAEVYDFPRLVKYLNGKSITITYQMELEELNKTRELIQHYGQVPDEKEAYRLVHASENWMKEFCTSAFAINYGKLSPTDLISNEGIRKTLGEAQEAYDNGKFEDAAIAAHFAIQQGKWIVKDKVMSRSYGHRLWRSDTEPLLRDVTRAIDDIDRRLDDVLDAALSATFASSFERLREITCAVFHRIAGGEPITQVIKQLRDHDPTADDAEFALELANEYLSWADQAYGLTVDYETSH
jgi:HEPN domain-containing protein